MKHDKKVFSVETPDESPGFLLWQVTALWQREIRKALEKYDLTHSQFVLLASTLWLSQHTEIVTQILLSAHTKIDPMTTSTVLRTLEKKGLLQRREHPTDTRAKTITLTEAGSNMAALAVKTVEHFDNAFFEPLGAQVRDFNARLLSLLAREGNSG